MSEVLFEVASATSRGLIKVFGKTFDALPLKVKEAKKYNPTIYTSEQAELAAQQLHSRKRDKKASITRQWLEENGLRTDQLAELIQALSNPSGLKRENSKYLLEIVTDDSSKGLFKVAGREFRAVPLSLKEDAAFDELYMDADIAPPLLEVLNLRREEETDEVQLEWLEELTAENYLQVLRFLRMPASYQAGTPKKVQA